jgi:hypothetical protein
MCTRTHTHTYTSLTSLFFRGFKRGSQTLNRTMLAHTHSLSLSLSHAHLLAYTHTLSLSLSLTHTSLLIHTLSISLSLSHAHLLDLPPFFYARTPLTLHVFSRLQYICIYINTHTSLTSLFFEASTEALRSTTRHCFTKKNGATPAYVSIRQHTSAYVSIRQHNRGSQKHNKTLLQKKK